LEFALEGRRRIKEQPKKLAAHDYAKTAFSYIDRDSGHEYWVEVPEQPEDLEAVLDVEAEEARVDGEVSSRARLATSDLIVAGESKRVEFEQTARVNLHTKQRDPVIEQMIVKSVAGFMNAEGGTLLIGVADNGDVFGVEADYKTLGKKQNQDGFALWLNGFLDNILGPTAASSVRLSFEEPSRRGSKQRSEVGARWKGRSGSLRSPQRRNKASHHCGSTRNMQGPAGTNRDCHTS
jgi:ATP-dependent Lon protease